MNHRISVRNLVESILMTGDIGSEMMILLPERAEEGSRVHRLHQERQKELNPSYDKEVYLKETFDFDDLSITVDGRADGYLPGEYLEEIKSTYLSPQALEDYDNPLHWAQLKFYAFMLCKRDELDELTLRLTYFHIETETLVSRDETHSFEELKDFVSDVLAIYLKLKRLARNWMIERNQSLKDLAFPFTNYRPGQREMAVNIYGTIRDRKNIFIQAPTGIGKTISALFPAVKAMPKGKTDRIFYLTPKSTGKDIGEESVQRMRQAGAKLRSLTLTSKDKICFMEEVKCEADYCPYAKGYYDKLLAAMFDLLETEDSLSRAVVEAYAKKHEICPFEFSLDLSLYADIIIGDYNYAFDPRVYLKRFFEEKTENYTFLVDESHNLLDRARSMFSAQVSREAMESLAEGFMGREQKISRKARAVADHLDHLYEAGANEVVQEMMDAVLVQRMEDFRTAVEGYLADEDKKGQRDKLKDQEPAFHEAFLDTYFEALSFLRIAELYSAGHRAYLRKGEELIYKLFCIDPSENLRKASQRADAIVFFSATLSPMDYYQALYGSQEGDYRMMLPSPFPKENLQVFLDGTVDTRYKVRDKSYQAIAENLALMARHRRGNYLAFFPSYRYLNQVLEEFEASFGEEFIVKVQEANLSESARLEVLKEFDETYDKSMIYFMVLGGVFAEGIDLKGDRLIGCAIIGLGYPQFDFERTLIQNYFEETKGQGFNYAYTYPGLNKVTQAAGRVIRSERDKGILLLMDSRYGYRNVKTLLPGSWFPLKSRDQLKKS